VEPDADSPPVAAIVLAAGAGTRFGGPKALLEFDGELLVERAVRLAGEAGCDPVLVVVGAAAEQVRESADLSDVEVVVAADWETGMSASLRAGLGAVAASSAGAAVVLLVDQPLVGIAAIERLRAAWVGGAVAAVATYDGRPRNPVLFDRSTWVEVSAAASGDVGARPWLQANRERVAQVECRDTGSPADIDTPADLDALRST
jgi:nicotine blue oxidoreductase